MTDPENTLEEWKETMQAEHERAIAEPDPDEDHRIEGITQVSYCFYYEYDPETDSLERTEKVQVDELEDPKLRSCSCGVRGMDPEEARQHVRAADEQS